jgi:uncharacterized protein YciI
MYPAAGCSFEGALLNFYLVLRHHASPIDDHARVIEHLSWMRRQHEGGTVLISGPSADGTAGIYVLRAPSRKDAAALAATDPLAQDGRARVEVIEWDVCQILGIGSFDPPRGRDGDVGLHELTRLRAGTTSA